MLNELLNYGGFAIGGGIITWVLIALFAPSVLSVVAEYLKALSPLVKGFAEGMVWLVKALWDGIKDIADNINTILTVAILVVSVFMYSRLTHTSVCNYEQSLAEIRKDYKFVKRTPAERAAYLRSKGHTGIVESWLPWKM